MSTIRTKLSPPWVEYMNKLQALFDGDPAIAFNIDYKNRKIVLSGYNGDKNAALLKVLPSGKAFGNVLWNIEIDGPIANRAFASNKELFEVLFDKNPAFAYCVAPAQDGYYFVDFTYVVFKNCVVQFFNDNLDDCHGLVSTLYQDIAAEIFADAHLNGVHYNTDIEVGKLGKPLGEWP